MPNTKNVEKILNERGNRYGDFAEMAAVAQAIKDAFIEGPSLLTPAQREAMEMIATKMARISCGDPNHKDNWDDIAGYATLISATLKGK